MRKVLNVKIVAFLILGLNLFACNFDKNQGESAELQIYTCSMHPEIIRNQPGTCPICKMDLVLKHSGDMHNHADTGLNTLVKPSNQYVLSGIKTILARKGVQSSEASLKGIINYNTNNWRSVSSRISGRIEKLYVKYNYEPVRKGQKIMDIYSPDLSNAQQELLFLKDNGESVLLESAKKKLLLLGLSNAQIEGVLRTGKLQERISIYSPYSGYIAEMSSGTSSSSSSAQQGSIQISSSKGDGMKQMGASSSSGLAAIPEIPLSGALLIREGQYVSEGQKLFNLINTDQVWAEFYAQPDQLSEFKRGNEVLVQSVDIPNQRQEVAISLIQPFYKNGSNFSLIRANLSNANKAWKVGQLIAVKRNIEMEGNWLPKTAVLGLGSRYVAFVKRDKVFLPVSVKLINQTKEWIDIGDSLDADTEFALNAWFLVDSESFIKAERL